MSVSCEISHTFLCCFHHFLTSARCFAVPGSFGVGKQPLAAQFALTDEAVKVTQFRFLVAATGAEHTILSRSIVPNRAFFGRYIPA